VKELIGRTVNSQGRVVIDDAALGRGGEGSVYSVLSHSFGSDLPPADSLVVKLYHEPSESDRGRKVAAMIESPPASNSVAWPLALIFNENKSFAGYLMVKLSSKNFRQWSELSNAKDRRATSSQFDVRYALTASRNLAVALDSVHAAGHRVGDVNESNLFVGSDATVLIVDTDSAQIQGRNGQIFPCPVGKPEYTAAELSHGTLRDQIRSVESDVFAYAVAVFQMLTGGSHPTDGIAPDDVEPPSTVDKIRQGVLPGLDPNSARGFQPISRIPTDAIPTRLHQLLTLALSPDPRKRPSLHSFATELASVLSNLKQCQKVKQHWFDAREESCLWCRHADAGKLDPWSPAITKASSNLSQAALPPVSFSDPAAAMPVRRAAPAVAGIQAASAHTAAGGQSASYPNQFGSQQKSSSTLPSTSHNLQAAPQQSYSGSQSLSHGSSTTQSTAATPQHPRKYKGKMILDYADGSWDVRPPMSILLKRNPKVAFYCIREETPDFAKAWWDNSRPVAVIWGMLIGLVLALVFSASWLSLIPLSAVWFPDLEWIPMILQYLSYASVATAASASLFLFFSALKDMLSAKKRYGSLDNLKREKIWKTSLRFLPIPLVYGPILLIIMALMLISSLLSSLSSSPRR
jgi:serine/threonine protein kinase